jgi:hypothetical protein
VRGRLALSCHQGGGEGRQLASTGVGWVGWQLLGRLGRGGGGGGCGLDKSVYYLKKCLLTGINSLKLACSESHGSTCRRRRAHYILTRVERVR